MLSRKPRLKNPRCTGICPQKEAPSAALEKGYCGKCIRAPRDAKKG